MFDSFGVRSPDFDGSMNHTHDYKKFYDDPLSSPACEGQFIPHGTPCNYEVSPPRYDWDRNLGQQLYFIFSLIRTIQLIKFVGGFIKPEKVTAGY